MRHIFFIIIFFYTTLFATQTLTIDQCQIPYTIGKDTSYYVDRTNALTLFDIQKKNFTDNNKNILNFGFLQPTYWFKTTYKYRKNMQNKKWWLKIDYPHLDYVDYYLVDKNNTLIKHKKSGDLVSVHERDINQNSILFLLPNNTTKTYTLYIRVVTSSAMLLPLQIISEDTLLKETHLQQTISGMYYGILLILVMYSLIIFIYTRENVYGLYVLFIISYALWQLSFDGLGMLYLWQDFYWMKEKGTVFFIYMTTFILLLFSKTLLKSKENIPRLHAYLLQPLLYISAIGIIFSVLFPYAYTIIFAGFLSIFVPTALFISGIMVLKIDYHSIKFFVIGWGIFLVATVLFTLSKFSIIESYILMKYGQQIGSALDLALLSMALAQRFIQLKNEYTQKLLNQASILERQVQHALRTERKKDQLLIEQSKFAAMGEMIEQIAHQWRQPLNNIGLINQDVYFKNMLGTLSSKDFSNFHTQIDTSISYLSNTIDDFRTYYKENKEKETYLLNDAIETILHITEATLKYHKIDIQVNLQHDVKVNNVKSELFQVLLNILNNAKDALLGQDINNKKIIITVTTDEKNISLSVLDNAGGIPEDILPNIFEPYFTTKQDNKGTGIGLYMSKNIVSNNMNGLLTVENKYNGACFKIILPLSHASNR